jgi:hypothetical protein
MSGEECSSGGIVELTVVVALNNFDRAVKLCRDKGNFFDKVEKVSYLTRKEKSLHKVGAIIKNEQVVFVARNTNNWRGPHITMD